MSEPGSSEPAFTIGPAQLEHAPDLARVHVRAWQAAYATILAPDFLAGLSESDRARRWRDILQQPAAPSQTLVARTDTDGVLAFVSLGPCRDEGAAADQGEIWALYADPAAWGRGLGRALLARAVGELRAQGYRAVSLWVLSDNLRGRRFYEACGFAPVAGSAKPFELGGRVVEEICYRLD